MKLTRAQKIVLLAMRAWGAPYEDSYSEMKIQTGFHGAVLDRIVESLWKKGLLTHAQGELTKEGERVADALTVERVG
jgi:hypothetical protein